MPRWKMGGSSGAGWAVVQDNEDDTPVACFDKREDAESAISDHNLRKETRKAWTIEVKIQERSQTWNAKDEKWENDEPGTQGDVLGTFATLGEAYDVAVAIAEAEWTHGIDNEEPQ